ncbi:MAG: peptidoglycan DD-metalloendopeptidase family protein [Rhodospirillales bacterium]|nr:MAG: peptidoglycan DD-metalloendopeptidase family protein [Rhodospirillales bacterium]
MNKLFAVLAFSGGVAMVTLAGVTSLTAPGVADEIPMLDSIAENERAAMQIAAYYHADSTFESRQLTASYDRDVVVGKGDTLMALMVKNGVAPREAHDAIGAMSKVFKPRYLKPGQEIVLTLQPSGAPGAADRLVSMTLVESVEREYVVRRDGDAFGAEKVDHPLKTEIAAAEGRIDVSLFMAGAEAGVPPGILADLIQIYSFDVDFQRDIRNGDGFTVMYERFVDETGTTVRTGNILRASMTLSGRERALYRFETANGTIDYFDEDGKSARRSLMRTPINGARLSSGYGNRRHPILGYTKLHTGTDFAAPRGTPIYAAGSGRIEYAGRKGGYGLYVRIRHNGTYQTAYAHMSGIARGVRKGTRVQQGQVIGYVGSTGRSTGNHLHYEVMRNGKFINSRRMHLPSGKQLKDEELETFLVARETADVQYAMLIRKDVEFASTAEPLPGCEGPDSAAC